MSKRTLMGILFWLASIVAAGAASAPPAMIVPGQFNVSATGGFTYTIPIAVPPGTAGMVPALSLDYSSQNGDGLEGLGWAIRGLPSIGRCARTLAQDGVHGSVNYDTTGDRFCMEGQRLVAISGSYGANQTIYRTEIEGFSRIESFCTSPCANGPLYFKVWTKSGQIMEFGNTTDSRIYPVKADGSGLMSVVRSWAVNKISDAKGNYINVSYTNNVTNGEVRPSEIDYTGNDGAGLTPFASVKFFYNLTRADPLLFYQAGAVQSTTVLLTNIETYVGSTLITNYKLAYNAATNGAQHDELTSVTQCDASNACLKATTFGWQGTRDTLSMTSTPNGTGRTVDNLFLPTDFNGDGLTDYMTDVPVCDIYVANQNGTFSTGVLTANYIKAGSSYSGPPCFDVTTQPWFEDYDGDGLTDFTFISGPGRRQWMEILHNNGTVFQLINDINTGGPQTTLWSDFNGDGRTDTYNLGAVLVSNGDGTYTTGQTGPTVGANTIIIPQDFDGDGCFDMLANGDTNEIAYFCNPAVTSATIPHWFGNGYQITVGDYNGDGISDILVANSSGATLYLSTGTGLSSAISIPNSTDWNKFSIYSGDWNGDGKADLILVADAVGSHYPLTTPHQIWLSTGSGFVEKATIANSGNNMDAPVSGVASIRPSIADWTNGGDGGIWLEKPSGDILYTFAYTPELMTSVSNGIGATTTVDYDRINENGIFYAKCSNGTYACGDSYPTQALDGPLYAVSEIDTGNGIGGTYVSTYSYTQAKTDLRGRGFLGFGSVSIKDQQTGIIQTTTYKIQWPYLGLIASQVKVCPTPICSTAVTLSSTTNTFEDLNLGTSTDGVTRHFVGLHQTVVSSKDLNGAAFPSAGAVYTYDCDNGGACAGTTPSGFGNAINVVSCQWDVAHNQCLTGGWIKTTTNAFSNTASSTIWYLGRLISANVESVVGASDLTRQTSYTYDSGSGLLTSEIVEPEASSDPTLKLETDYGYDAFGNKTGATTKGCVWISSSSCSTTASTAARATSTQFNATTLDGQFPTQITNALNQSETWAYAATNNVAFGVPSSHTGPNGLTTTWSYDTFGRKTLEVRPDGNKTAIAYTYCTGLPTGESCPANAKFDVIGTPENSSGAQNGPITITYYDALSRAIATDSEGFDATGTGCTNSAPCWIRVSTIYDANGRVASTSRPFFLAGITTTTCNAAGGPKCTVFTYDAIGRATKATYPDSSKTTFGFNGLTTTVTNDKSQVTTTVKNAQGLNASVTDAYSKTTSYVYDAFGDLLTVTDPSSNVTTNRYDIRGRKICSSDPDMGGGSHACPIDSGVHGWSYVYDAFGELYSQTDAKVQVTTLTYDALGRVLGRVEPSLTSTWRYDAALGKGIGQLASATTGSNYTRSYAYDSLGRPSTIVLTVDGVPHVYHTTYNPDGRISTVDYPSGLTALYVYTALGYQYQLKDYNAGTVFWTAKTRDAELHLLTQTAGNGITTTQTFNANTGLITATQAGTSNGVANQSYSYDTLGNLTSRTWLNNSGVSVKENACYDNLNRLTNTFVTSGTTCTGTGSVTVAYDALGNITEKSDVCAAANCMVYGAGAAGPHALTSIIGSYNSVSNPSFTYDANGNMTAGAGRGITVTNFNMAAAITDGVNSASLTYDTEHARIKQVTAGANAGTTYYLNDPASGMMEESFISAGTSAPTYRDYLMADGHMVGLRTQAPSTVPPVWGDPTTTWGSFTWTASSPPPPVVIYFVLDYLGSISVVTDSSGAVVERDSYDAWGKRRNADGTAAACGTLSSATTRGFTGQEMMDGVCFVNFNARVYDPSLGRFMSADSYVPNAFDLQSFNRYSYVNNHPLSLIDPSGNIPGIDEVVVTAAASNPITAPIAILLDILSDIFGFGDLFGSATPPPVHVHVTVNPPNPAQSPTAGGSPSGIPQMQNMAVPTNEVDQVVVTATRINSDATITSTAAYAGAGVTSAIQIVRPQSSQGDAVFGHIPDWCAQMQQCTWNSSGYYQGSSAIADGNIESILVEAPRWTWLNDLSDFATRAFETWGNFVPFGVLAAGSIWAAPAEAALTGGTISSEWVAPTRLARVIAGHDLTGLDGLMLAPEQSADAFVVNAQDIAGLNTSGEISERLTLVDENGSLIEGPHTVVEFDTPQEGLAQPAFRQNPGFVGGGSTLGGVPEYTVPNVSIDQLQNVTIRVVH
ncbi:MAG TPA: polymorphic toxin type 10 domain-containing protein [Rhizomicrobium sp.]